MTTGISGGYARQDRMRVSAASRLVALGAGSFGLYACSALLQHALGHPTAAGGVTGRVLLFALYLLVTAAIFGTYWLILDMCRKGGFAHGRLLPWAVGLACVLQAGLALLPPELSKDMLNYVALGFLCKLPGHNPLAEPAKAAQLIPMGADLRAWNWHPDPYITPYGIIWTWIEIGIGRIAGNSVAAAFLMFKGLIVAANFMTAFLLWRFVGLVAPHRRQLALLAFLWNPLILVELASEGHNDAIMILCAMAALTAAAYGRTTASVFLQLCGVLTKYVTVLLAPAQLVYLWRTRQHGAPRLILQIAAGTAMAAALGALLYAPVWLGVHSFDGTVHQGQPMSSASLFGVINWTTRRSIFAAHQGPITLALVLIPTVALVIWVSLRVRDAVSLAHAFAWIAVCYLLVTSPWYWPWYACLSITMLIAADTQRYLWVIFMFAVVGRAVAPLDLFEYQGFLTMHVAKGIMTGLGSLVPLIVLLIWVARGARPGMVTTESRC